MKQWKRARQVREYAAAVEECSAKYPEEQPRLLSWAKWIREYEGMRGLCKLHFLWRQKRFWSSLITSEREESERFVLLLINSSGEDLSITFDAMNSDDSGGDTVIEGPILTR
jgi:hypothetical protein